MPRFTKRTSKKSGLPPGSLVHIGEKKQEHTRITVITYGEGHLQETHPEEVEAVFPLPDAPANAWVNIDGVHDMALIEKIGRHFAIHPLTLEDTVNTTQRPKMEEFDDYIYIVFKMLRYDDAAGQVQAEQVSLILGERYLISFQEVEGDVFEGVRERIRKGRGRIRRSGSDYLAHALMDCVVDNYLVVLEHLGEKVEMLEERLYRLEGRSDLTNTIFRLQREMIYFRKQIWPLQETLSRLKKSDNPLIREDNRVFFADAYDHLVHGLEVAESLRDVLAGLQDLAFAMTGQRMNEIMKVLTVIATIFIPITFLAGIYGMNFEYMPELSWRWGYPAVWGVSIAVTIGLVVFFKRRHWL